MFTRTLKASINEGGILVQRFENHCPTRFDRSADQSRNFETKLFIFIFIFIFIFVEISFVLFFSTAISISLSIRNQSMILELRFTFVGLEIEWLESCNCFARSCQLLTRSGFALDQGKSQITNKHFQWLIARV